MSNINVEDILENLRSEREKTASDANAEFQAALTGTEKTAESTEPAQTQEPVKNEEPKEPAQEPAQESAKTASVLSDDELLQKLASDGATQMQVAQADLIGRALARGYHDELQQLIMPATNYPAPQMPTGGSIPAKEGNPATSPAASSAQANPGEPGGSEKNASVDIITALYQNNFS